MSSPLATDLPPAVLEPAPRRLRRWLSRLLMLVIFVSGLIIGGGATLIAVKNRLQSALEHPEQEATRRAATLRRELKLTPEQTKRLEQILRNRFLAIWWNVRGEMDQLDQEIAAVLDQQQKERWRASHPKSRAEAPPKPAELSSHTKPSQP